MTKDCITLIGMPACGKSSVGVVLAKKTGRRFIDGDLLIQEQTGKLLKELIAELGDQGFRALEDQINAEIRAEHAVIAPGGSVVYGEQAMRHLKELGTVVYLKLPYTAIRRRLGNLEARGVSIRKGQTLRQLYDERVKLYEQYADITVDETRLNTRQVVEAIVQAVESAGHAGRGAATAAREERMATGEAGGRDEEQRRNGKEERQNGGQGANGWKKARSGSGSKKQSSSGSKEPRGGRARKQIGSRNTARQDAVEAGKSPVSGARRYGELRRSGRK